MKDKVRLCKRDVCVEASGNNAKMIVGALAFAIICAGAARLAQ